MFTDESAVWFEHKYESDVDKTNITIHGVM